VSSPAAASSLDLPAPVAPASPTGSLDLSAPATVPASLDLSAPVAASTPLAASTRPARPKTVASHPIPAAASGARIILTPQSPVLALSRLQTGIGTLLFEAACSAQVGDLALGCAYQLRSGRSSIVQHSAGNATAVRDSRTAGNAAGPLILSSRDSYERIAVDLRHVREIERLLIYALSPSGQQLRWGGTLVASTIGGARLELPLDRPASAGVAVLMSVFNVDRRFVLRAEMEIIAGSIRDACKAYGYDNISWLDDHTPVT
jgi:uncharacterized protein involved in tellurium resistance